MRTLVTGAGGFIGSRVCALAPSGTDAVPLEGDLLAGDPRMPEDIDAVVHLAHPRPTGDAEADIRALEGVTVDGTARLLERARAAGARRFLLASTATVYARSPRPLAEDAPLDLSSDYARAKVAAERVLAEGADGISAMALRIFTPYGPGQRDRLIARLIDRVRAGEPVQVEGERGLLLSPIHVDDVAAAILAALELDPEPGVTAVNVGVAEALGIREIATRIGAVVGREPVFEELGGEEPGGLTADVTRMRALLPGVRPRPFAEGIRQTAGG
jgi:nucleoside-diphosphate-sugar epimerase